jgi:hypothetical protein
MSYVAIGFDRIRLLLLPALLLALVFSTSSVGANKGASTDRINLALHKPASSSSIENDEHSAAQANDGDPTTSWRADDEPEGGPEWWQVDLQKPMDLSGCQICWPYDGKNYRYKIEGSADRKNWSILSDQTNTISKSQVHNLKFKNARQIRYVKVTITGFDEGCWASLSEVKLFGIP